MVFCKPRLLDLVESISVASVNPCHSCSRWKLLQKVTRRGSGIQACKSFPFRHPLVSPFLLCPYPKDQGCGCSVHTVGCMSEGSSFLPALSSYGEMAHQVPLLSCSTHLFLSRRCPQIWWHSKILFPRGMAGWETDLDATYACWELLRNCCTCERGYRIGCIESKLPPGLRRMAARNINSFFWMSECECSEAQLVCDFYRGLPQRRTKTWSWMGQRMRKEQKLMFCSWASPLFESVWDPGVYEPAGLLWRSLTQLGGGPGRKPGCGRVTPVGCPCFGRACRRRYGKVLCGLQGISPAHLTWALCVDCWKDRDRVWGTIACVDTKEEVEKEVLKGSHWAAGLVLRPFGWGLKPC